MSAEAITNSTGAEFRARPAQTTERGTEVAPSRTGNRILDAANRVANFLDRFKVGRQETRESAQEAAERSRQFVRETGEKAAKIAITSGEIALGVAVMGIETTGRTAVKVGHAVERGAQAVGNKVTEIADYAEEGLVGGIDYLSQKGDAAVEWTAGKISDAKRVSSETVGYVKEGVLGGIDFAKQKGTDAKEAALDKIEAVKSFFKEKAEAAKTRRDERRARWATRITASKEAATATLERSKEKGTEFRVKAQKRGHAAVMAARAARIVYSANVATK